MPTYDYECRACSHVFETMHAMSAPALKKCPKCGKLKLVRLISGGAGVIFKGGGFYETDYKRKRPGAGSAQGSESSSTKSEGGDAAKGASGPDAKGGSSGKTDPSSKKDAPKKD